MNKSAESVKREHETDRRSEDNSKRKEVTLSLSNITRSDILRAEIWLYNNGYR